MQPKRFSSVVDKGIKRYSSSNADMLDEYAVLSGIGIRPSACFVWRQAVQKTLVASSANAKVMKYRFFMCENGLAISRGFSACTRVAVTASDTCFCAMPIAFDLFPMAFAIAFSPCERLYSDRDQLCERLCVLHGAVPDVHGCRANECPRSPNKLFHKFK